MEKKINKEKKSLTGQSRASHSDTSTVKRSSTSREQKKKLSKTRYRITALHYQQYNDDCFFSVNNIKQYVMFHSRLKKKTKKKKTRNWNTRVGGGHVPESGQRCRIVLRNSSSKVLLVFFLLGFTGFSYSLDSQVRSCFFRFFLFVGFLSFFFCLETNVLAPYRHVTQSANTKIKKKNRELEQTRDGRGHVGGSSSEVPG